MSVAVLLLLFVAVFVAYRYVQPVTKVVVGPKWFNQAQFAGLFAAQEQGIYRNRGLDVSFKEFGFETNTIEDLVNKKTDFAITSAEQYLLARDAGQPIQAVAAFYQISPYTIVSLSDSGIESPADLRHKKLGNKGGKVEEDLIYTLLLNTVGLAASDAARIELGFYRSELDDLLQHHADTVDLYRTDQLYHFNQKKVSYTALYPEQFGINSFNDVLVVRSELLQSNPTLITNFVRGSVEGWESAARDPERALQDTLKHVTSTDYKDVDYERFILKQSLPLVMPSTYGSVGVMSLTKWDQIYEQMLQNGLIKGTVPVDAVFTNQFLP